MTEGGVEWIRSVGDMAPDFTALNYVATLTNVFMTATECIKIKVNL